jgi:hypothetical protein
MGRNSWGLLPMRQYWQEINRLEREAKALEQAKREASDEKRSKCRCAAYPWPHRPSGRFGRHPDPPLERWQRKPESKYRPYRRRYAGILRQIARMSRFHPIRDRALIDKFMPSVMQLAKELKQQKPRLKYRNMQVTKIDGTKVTLTGNFQTAGPMM